MTYLGNLTSSDRMTFEGREVTNVTPVMDQKTKQPKNYRLSIINDDGGVDLRTFCIEEVSHLLDAEVLIIEKGYNSPVRQHERALYGGRELFGATKRQRDNVDLTMQTCMLMDRYRKSGMKLTRSGVQAHRASMDADYAAYQSKKFFGTQKPNASQALRRLPSADTLLRHYRKYRAADKNPNVFLAPRAQQVDHCMQAHADFNYVLDRLREYAHATRPSKAKVISSLIRDLKRFNEEREENRISTRFDIHSQRTYERWIDQYLDPFQVVLQREGLAAAQRKFGTSEGGRCGQIPGELVEIDAWQFHLLTLDCTREEWNRMNEEQRAGVRKVRRWVIFIQDSATRVMLGFSICRAPNERASLEALRMAFMDKTYLLREIGITDSKWNYACPIQEIVNDNGSEFGKNPFGGALFSRAVSMLGGTQMNTVAGVSQLRGRCERFFWTLDLQFARYLPGYTAHNPQARNDRKFLQEACITDDELHILLLAYVAQYHKTPHRGLNGRTPDAVWAELTNGVEYDYGQMPSKGQLREACGFYVDAKFGKEGIQYAGLRYSNEFVRSQRKVSGARRVAMLGETVEIKVDPFDLGSISICKDGEFIRVPCLNTEMMGKSLRAFQNEKAIRKRIIEAENLAQEGARNEAADLWETLNKQIMRTADIGMIGYTEAEVRRAARELEFGKGQHEKPFVGRDEYVDPMSSGGFEVDGDPNSVEVDSPTPLDRFRSSAKSRKKRNPKEGK